MVFLKKRSCLFTFLGFLEESGLEAMGPYLAWACCMATALVTPRTMTSPGPSFFFLGGSRRYLQCAMDTLSMIYMGHNE